MTTFYLDYVNGSDAADGSDWANAWKTITTGATAARIAPGDIIRIAKSPDPSSLGQSAQWTNGPIPATQVPTSSTNASPIVITKNAHGYLDGDVVQVLGHTTNTAANGTWIVANKTDNTLELAGSVGNGTGGATGTMRNINAKTVLLTSAVTAHITNCSTNWTASANVTCALNNTNWKEGAYCQSIAFASGFSTGKAAYFDLGSDIDFSAYRQVSLWFRNSVAIASASVLRLDFCSDTTGDTPVDSFAIPAIPSTARFLPLTFDKGSALGTYRSVALYAVADPGTPTILLDNILACKNSSSADSLTLQSLISKNSAAQGGDEGWYGIQSINGRIVMLDGETETVANAGRGYSGTTESVATYKRETIKTALTTSFTAVQSPTDSGTLAAYIQYQGGFNTSDSNQDGETYFDGLSGQGYGLNLSSKNYNLFNFLNFNRYYYGMNIGSSGWLTFTNISNINSNTYYGISVSGYQITFGEIKNTNQNGSHGLAINSVYGLLIGILRSSSGNLGQSGIFMSSVTGFIGLANISNNAQYGVYFSSPSEVTIKSLTTTANNNAAIYANGGSLYLLGATLNETTVTSIAGGYNGRIYSQGEDGSANNNWIYVESGTINSQAVTRGGASGLEWKHTITSSTRLSEFPLFLSLAKIAVAANAQVTVTAYFTKSHATNIEGRLVCKGGQIAGVDNDVVSSAMAANTNAQQITIQFTPTAAGVVEILSEAYYVAANGYVLVDTVGISQA